MEINWCYFSLRQVNHPDRDAWKIWEQPSLRSDWLQEQYAPSLRAFWSAEAARRQGSDAFFQYHLALLRERHQRGKSLHELETLLAAAKEAGLDIGRFEEALEDRNCLQRLAWDHTRAAHRGIFGTPTFVLPGAEPVYLKLTRLLTPEEALDLWGVFRSTAVDRSYLLEFKRPH